MLYNPVQDSFCGFVAGIERFSWAAGSVPGRSTAPILVMPAMMAPMAEDRRLLAI
jgi:hypothetical protein